MDSLACTKFPRHFWMQLLITWGNDWKLLSVSRIRIHRPVTDYPSSTSNKMWPRNSLRKVMSLTCRTFFCMMV